MPYAFLGAATGCLVVAYIAMFVDEDDYAAKWFAASQVCLVIAVAFKLLSGG